VSLILWIALILLGLLSSGFFEGSELAIISCDRVKMEQWAKQNKGRARAVLSLLRHPERFFSATLLGSDISIVTASALAEWLVNRYLPGLWSTIFSTVIMTLAVLVLAQILPKSLGLKKSNFIALNSAYPLRLLSALFLPLIRFVEILSKAVIRFLWKGEKAKPYISRQEIRMLVSSSPHSSSMHHQIRMMVDQIFDFSEVKLEEIMVPTEELISLGLDATVDDAVRLITEQGYTRLPVYRGDRDNIVGVVVADDLLAEKKDRKLLELLRIPQVVSKDAFSEDVLQLLRKDLLKVAFVAEEEPRGMGGGMYAGKIIGMVTLEDLVEEIVGDIWDEYDF